MKSLILVCICFGLTYAQADHVAPRTASARIKKVVDAFRPFAWSGVSHYKIKKGLSIRETLNEVADRTTGNDQFNWATEDQDAWEADSTLWGWTNMRVARSYMTSVDDAFWSVADENGNREKLEAKFEKAKEMFSQLEHTGVTFGIAPLGAVQCGIQLAALAVIDPYTGNVWIIAMEGSGC